MSIPAIASLEGHQLRGTVLFRWQGTLSLRSSTLVSRERLALVRRLVRDRSIVSKACRRVQLFGYTERAAAAVAGLVIRDDSLEVAMTVRRGEFVRAQRAAPAAPKTPHSGWHDAVIRPDAALVDVLPLIRTRGIAVVVDPMWRLLGTLTDTDVRRALLDGARLDDPAGKLMNVRPAVISRDRAAALETDPPSEAAALPILDEQRRVIGIRMPPEPYLADRLVVVMAGGLGRRLRPLTERSPKPLVPIGGRPLVELAVESLQKQGFRQVLFCVGYGAEMIQDHFGDGERFSVRVDYLHDGGQLGTAGPLTLLARRPAKAFLVVNGDILTDTDFRQLIAYHDASGAAATMCICEVGMQVPYGVVSVSGGEVQSLREKPVERYSVNAGMYVLEPRVLDAIAGGRSVSMPEVFDILLRRGDRVAAFPVHEQWIDVGSPSDLAYARETLTISRPPEVQTDTGASGQTRPTARQPVEVVFEDL